MKTLPGHSDKEGNLIVTSSTTIYRLWRAMRGRCNSENYPKYSYYGGKGVKVCEEWNKSFYSFYEYVKSLENFDKYITDNYTLDRIKNELGYEPNNIRWASKTSQVINRESYNKSTGYTGIKYTPKCTNKPYSARVFFQGKETTVGYYKTLEEAVNGRNEYITKNKLPHNIQIFAEKK